ncbi:E3 ubiquitin-protein ligase UBR1 [Thelohanellus kitauei]|uniref:E3 ubiquitin-protein ligase n=1 Tax=Thelohanellus kitauei TaxID=669202 RepID=A0A0C2MCD2_THEKT|nr:E3 ubiquitin-protein ligase UBR1 [Thelohanellus kitauei]
MTDTFREEFEIRIDQIITRALLNTSNNPESDPQKIYDAFPLHKLVITPVLDALFERIDSETKNIFFSKDGALGRCRKMLTSAEKIYTCNDCSLNISRSLCEECFIDSCHVKHNFSETSVEYDLFCHCGDQEAFGKSFPCGIHQIPKNSRRLPKHFVKRIGNIIRRFLKYLELLCGDDESLETQVNECLLTKDNLRKLNLKEDLSGIRFPDQNQMKNTNAHKWCVLIFQPDDESPECADSCLRFAKPPGVLTDLQSNFEMCGFLCVKYRDTKKNCQTFKVRIQRFIHESLPGSGLHCRIVKVHRLSFMKLSSTLTEWIYNTCLRKSELCDLMSEILFNETTLPQKFFFNRNLWNEIRFITTHRIFLSILFSQNRARHLSDFYLENFDQLYSEVLVNTDLMHHLYSWRLSYRYQLPNLPTY